ncbi:LysR substrate-binding domain-containing protein [Burkholderia sp. 22PA0099]|uniref:LysR substrate-binding domain-containing protein n=1 Tax=unclassified Burkholderia TaxID=2613784 RepID=UPI0039C27BC6
MELKLLRAFLTVAELRHFGRAADALHLSQPALSKQIGALETSVGGRLFERGRHGAELTTFGETFVTDAQSLVRDADEILARARETSGGKRGHLRIGICLSVLTLVPPLIAEFRRQHPLVSITLSDLSSAEQTRRMLAGKLEAGFLRLPSAPGLASFGVLDERLALALPPQWQQVKVPAQLDALNDLGFVMLQRSRGAGLAAQVDRWCRARGFVPNVSQQAEDVQSVLASVAAGAGVAFIPSGARHLLRDATVQELRDRDAKWRVGLGWPEARHDAVTARFVSFMRGALRKTAA